MDSFLKDLDERHAFLKPTYSRSSEGKEEWFKSRHRFAAGICARASGWWAEPNRFFWPTSGASQTSNVHLIGFRSSGLRTIVETDVASETVSHGGCSRLYSSNRNVVLGREFSRHIELAKSHLEDSERNHLRNTVGHYSRPLRVLKPW